MSPADQAALLEALKDATAALTGAASAYRKHAKRVSTYTPKASIDPFFTTRVKDMDKAVARAQKALLALTQETP